MPAPSIGVTVAPVAGGLREALARVHEVGPLAAERAEACEQRGCLTEDVVEALHSAGLLRVLIPDDLGGLGLTLPESVEVFRAMAAYGRVHRLGPHDPG